MLGCFQHLFLVKLNALVSAAVEVTKNLNHYCFKAAHSLAHSKSSSPPSYNSHYLTATLTLGLLPDPDPPVSITNSPNRYLRYYSSCLPVRAVGGAPDLIPVPCS